MQRVYLLLFSPYLLMTAFACHPIDKQGVAKTFGQPIFPAPPDSAWWTSSGIHRQPAEISYEQVKSQINQERKALNDAFQKGDITLDSVRKVFTQNLLNRIIPYWYPIRQ